MLSRRDFPSYLASTFFHGALLALLFGMRFAVASHPVAIGVEGAAVDDPEDQRIIVEGSDPEPPVLHADAVAETPADGSATAVASAVSSTLNGTGSGGSGHGGISRGPTVIAAARMNEGIPGHSLGIMQFSRQAEDRIADGVERAVQGERAVAVSNYEQALSRIASELIQMMRERPVMVVWLFDESESMRDDQAAIRANFQTVYKQIGLEISSSRPKADKARGKGKSKPSSPLVSAVVGFGQHVHPVISKPTGDLKTLQGAIDKLTVDDSGRENTATAIAACLDQYRLQARQQKRQLTIVVVTDESGDDWQHLEELIDRTRENNVKIFVLGRESIFGFPIARVKWIDPVYGLTHWIPINRGPETPEAECLQWDGLHDRWDAFSSGAGPYELARLASESKGIYFVLPEEERDLAGAGANEAREAAFLNLKQYQPELESRDEYVARREASRLRSTIFSIIRTLNPHRDPQLNIRELHYPVEPAAFQVLAQEQFQRALRGMMLLSEAIRVLDEARSERAAESSQRWRADYDLLCAQCLAYRVRLFQFLLALDQHAKSPKPLKSPTNNCFNVVRRREMLPPDEEQVRITNVNLGELTSQEKKAREMFAAVVKEHAGTPWARRAQYELNTGFGMAFVEGFLDPRYREVGTTIKLPSL